MQSYFATDGGSVSQSVVVVMTVEVRFVMGRSP
jgi:hypothetical protein